MRRTIKYLLCCLSLFPAILPVGAQVSIRASSDKNRILIGEPVQLTIAAYTPLGVPVEWFRIDSIPHFEIDARSEVDTVQNIDGRKITQTLSITSFDSGSWQIAPFEVHVAGKPYYSDSVGIEVAFTPFDPNEDYRDIRDIIVDDNPYPAIAPWIVGLMTVVFGVLLFVLLRRRKARPPVIEEQKPALSNYQQAMRDLDQLGQRGAIHGEKEYYSTLNDILRRYVSGKYNIATFERTNEELIRELSRMSLPKDAFEALTASLRIFDFVKFAKYRPLEKDHQDNLNTVRSSIHIMNNNIVGVI